MLIAVVPLLVIVTGEGKLLVPTVFAPRSRVVEENEIGSDAATTVMRISADPTAGEFLLLAVSVTCCESPGLAEAGALSVMLTRVLAPEATSTDAGTLAAPIHPATAGAVRV